MYQQVLCPGHAVSRRQTQSNRDEAQHGLPYEGGPAFGLCWPLWVLLLLRTVSGQVSIWGQATVGEAHYGGGGYEYCKSGEECITIM